MKSNKDIVRELAKKQERLLELIKQYDKAKQNEHKMYHLFEDKEVNRKENYTDIYKCNQCGKESVRWFCETHYKYYLVNRFTKDVVCYGDKQRIKSYMRIRNISLDDVWDDVDKFGKV